MRSVFRSLTSAFAFPKPTQHVQGYLMFTGAQYLIGTCIVFGVMADATLGQGVFESAVPSTVDESQRPQVPIIADEPRFVDRGQFLPEKLATLTTIDLTNATFETLIQWLRNESSLTVVVEYAELQKVGVLMGDVYSDRLDNAPVYYLLDRLQQMRVGWYIENGILFITSEDKVESRQTSVAYPLGDLLEKNFSAEGLAGLIRATISPDSWDENDGSGRMDLIGDTLFVLSSNEVHLQVRGLLVGLLNPARQTYISDSAANAKLRETLETTIQANYLDLPLSEILEDLGKRSGIDIRLEPIAARSSRVRARNPLNLAIGEQSLKTILAIALEGYELVPVVRNGVLWIGPREESERDYRTAIYDVRDLCRDLNESAALAAAIASQMPGIWVSDSGSASIEFALPGIMVVWATTDTQRQLLTLLERYRAALMNSKPRNAKVATDEVVTRFYRLHPKLAEELVSWIPRKIAPTRWKSATQTEAVGTIEIIESIPEWVATRTDDKDRQESGLLMERKTLVICQHESIHDEIIIMIRRIENGDTETLSTRDERESQGIRGMGGGMGGGFGGVFSIPELAHPKYEQRK